MAKSTFHPHSIPSMSLRVLCSALSCIFSTCWSMLLALQTTFFFFSSGKRQNIFFNSKAEYDYFLSQTLKESISGKKLTPSPPLAGLGYKMGCPLFKDKTIFPPPTDAVILSPSVVLCCTDNIWGSSIFSRLFSDKRAPCQITLRAYLSMKCFVYFCTLSLNYSSAVTLSPNRKNKCVLGNVINPLQLPIIVIKPNPHIYANIDSAWLHKVICHGKQEKHLTLVPHLQQCYLWLTVQPSLRN